MKATRGILAALILAAGLAGTGVVGGTAAGMSPDDRISYRQMLLLNLPTVPQFDQWIRKTNELPPDFDALPRQNALPDPLTFLDGKPVKTAEDWKARRAEILELYQKYVWGSIPPHAKFDHAEMQEVAGTGYRTRMGRIFVGPEGKGMMRITMQIPDGKGPFPVVMGPGLVGGMDAAAAGTIRAHGCIVASIAASDGNDESVNMAALYPQSDPGALPRRGWAASSVVDYLETLPEVDAKRIAITGYSRDAKAMVIGAALDERIAAVIAGSPGVGGILPFRMAGERNQAESIQSTTLMFPDWFHPRLRYFIGREDRLPVDGNLLLAAIAPRPFFLVAGNNDEVSNDWGDEQSFHSADKAYQLLGAKDKLGILRVPGYHGANDWEQAMTFLDIQFLRSDKKWTNQWMFPWDFEAWKKATGETIDLAKYADRRGADLLTSGVGAINTPSAWEAKAAEVRKNMQWMLGDQAPAVKPVLTPTPLPAESPDVAAWVVHHGVDTNGNNEFGWYAASDPNVEQPNFVGVLSRAVTFNGIKGTLYYSPKAQAAAGAAGGGEGRCRW